MNADKELWKLPKHERHVIAKRLKFVQERIQKYREEVAYHQYQAEASQRLLAQYKAEQTQLQNKLVDKQ